MVGIDVFPFDEQQADLPMIRQCKALMIAAFLAGALAGPAAAAESWVFQRSYYSHEPAERVQIGPRATGGPYYTRPRGVYVNSGYRNLRSTIRIGGRTYDHLNVWESWVQTGSQF